MSESADAWDRCVEFWFAHAKGLKVKRTYSRTRGVGRKLRAAINNYGEETVLDAMRWMCLANHRDARWLRANRTPGSQQLETVCNNAEKYADNWQAFGEGTSQRVPRSDTRSVVGHMPEGTPDWSTDDNVDGV